MKTYQSEVINLNMVETAISTALKRANAVSLSLNVAFLTGFRHPGNAPKNQPGFFW